jgi:hypothetical protein
MTTVFTITSAFLFAHGINTQGDIATFLCHANCHFLSALANHQLSNDHKEFSMTTNTTADTAIEAIDAINEVPMRVLKVGTTASLSNRSTLGYAIGCDESNAIYLSLRSNTAAGMFSTNWIAFLDIANALVHADRISSATFVPSLYGSKQEWTWIYAGSAPSGRLGVPI